MEETKEKKEKKVEKTMSGRGLTKEEKDHIEVGEKKKETQRKTKSKIKEEPVRTDDSDNYYSSSRGEDSSDSTSSNDYVSYPSAADNFDDSDICTADSLNKLLT